MVMKYVKVINDLNINIEKLRNAYENCTKNFVTDKLYLVIFNQLFFKNDKDSH